jgi:nucleotide-binding universal stress UspA family protein
VLVAIFAVFAAPRLQRRFGTPKTLYVNLTLLALDLVVIAVFTSSKATLIVAVIVSGAFIGLNNTLTTQAVMLVAPVERPVASASYGFVRFIGGGLAPYCASKLAAAFNVHVPFYLGAGAVVIGVGVLASGHSLLTRAEEGFAREPELDDGEEEPIVVALEASEYAGVVTGAAIELARLLHSGVEIVHVMETDIVEEQAVEVETTEAARRVIAAGVEQLHAAGIPATGNLFQVVGDHGDVGRRIAEFANDHQAQMIVISRRDQGPVAGLFDVDLANQVVEHAHCDVHVVRLPPAHEPVVANRMAR